MSDDIEAAADAGSRSPVVACFLCATFAPLPQRWKQGRLQLDPDGVRWAPGMFKRDGGSLLPSPLRLQTVRDVRGWERLHIKAEAFQVIEIKSDQGEIRLAVPRERVPLMVERLGPAEPPG